jgi:hypothetical protein
MPLFPGKDETEHGCKKCARELVTSRTRSAKTLQRANEKVLDAQSRAVFQADNVHYSRILAVDAKLEASPHDEALVAKKTALEKEWKDKAPELHQKYLELVAAKATLNACLAYSNDIYLWEFERDGF